MAAPCVLMYNLEGEAARKLASVLAPLGLRVRQVAPEQYGAPLALLAAGRGERGEAAPPLGEPMLVFCGVAEGTLDRALAALRRPDVPRVGLKAVLTPSNAMWDARRLHAALAEERQAFQSAQKR